MAHPVTETFNGGLVNSRHPALLQPGELQRADDCVYRDNDPAIWGAPGRTVLTQAAVGTKIKGIGQLGFDGGISDQFLLYSGTALWAAPLTAVPIATALTEVGGQWRYFGTVSGTTTLDAQIVVASCTIASTVVTTSNSFANVQAGDIVSGTGVAADTTVLSVDTATTLTLSDAATNGTVTLTFTNYPFLVTALGCKIRATGIPASVYITAISNQDGATGHYRTATLSAAVTNAVYAFTSLGGVRFSMEDNVAGSETLEFVQYGASKYYVWNGSGSIKAIEWRPRTSEYGDTLTPVLSLRPVGLKPVEQPFTVAVQHSQATGWSTIQGPGTYWVLITELYCPLDDVKTAEKDKVLRTQIVESAYLGTDAGASDVAASKGLPIKATITTVATDNILVTFPTTITNDGRDGYLATHWGVYIYGPSLDRPSLALMRRCATVPINVTSRVLSDTSVKQGPFYPSVAGAVVPPAGGATRPQFSVPANMLGAPNGNCGESTSLGVGTSFESSEKLSSFVTFINTTPYDVLPLIGLEIQITGRPAVSPYFVDYWYRIRANASDSGHRQGTFAGMELQKKIHGGATDLFSDVWVKDDLPGIYVEIGQVNSGTLTSLQIDSVGLVVYFGTVNVDFNGPAYRVVTYRDQVGLSVSDPAKLLPPSCSTGDFFSGSFVIDDLVHKNLIRYSLPGDPEAWPAPYEMSFNTRKRDKVTLIRTLGAILIVGMETGIKRVNYLPRETDTDMNSGLAHEDIVTDHGIPGPFCAAKFDMPGVGITLAYVSANGIFLTDGRNSTPLNNDLNWANTVKVTALSTAIMRVYPKEKWIALYYCPAGAVHNFNTRVLYFCYQADKVKQGGLLPAVGPCIVSARSVCEAYVSGVHYLFTGHESDGFVYVEDAGLSNPSGYKTYQTAQASTNGDGRAGSGDVIITPLVRTRKMYPAGIENDAREERILILYSSYGAAITKTAATTINSAVVVIENTAAVTVIPGHRVTGTGIDPGVIVLSKTVGGTNTDVTLSRASNASGTVTLSFDTGTIGITVRGSGVGEIVTGCDTSYASTFIGDLLVVHNDNMRQGLELQIEKVPLTFDSNHDTATWAALETAMRLNQFTVLVINAGLEQNRATS